MVGDQPEGSGDQPRMVSPFAEMLSLSNMGLEEIRYELFRSGDWNTFIGRTIIGDKVALSILRRQIHLEPSEMRNLYSYMVKNVDLNIYALQEAFPESTICDRTGKIIQTRMNLMQAYELVKEGPPGKEKKGKHCLLYTSDAADE